MRTTRVLTAVCVAGFLLVPAARPAGQAGQSGAQTSGAPQVTFRAGTNFVEVDAFITDGQGNFVRDLSRDEFTVLEDGQPVDIDTFTLVDIPIEPGEPADEADEMMIDEGFYAEVVTNDRDFDGRIYLIVLDANQISPLRTTQTKTIARRFVLDNMSGADQAAVVHIGSEKISQDFTSNKRLLLDSIDQFTGQKLRSAVLNKFDDATLKAGVEGGLEPARDPDAVQRAAMARQTMESVRNLSNYMAGIRGRRKAMVLLSEGVSFNMDDTIGPSHLGYDLFRDNDATEAQYAADIALDMQAMIETATRSNVVIYSVDPRGLTSESDEAMSLTGSVGEGGLSGEAVDAVAGEGTTASISPENVIRGLRDELNRSHTQLRSLAEQTGGIATVNTNSIDTGLERIVEDNSTYYLLGYNTEPKYDGKFHEITVRVNRPGVEVRARKGYYASRENPATVETTETEVLRNLLSSPMPMSGLTMSVSPTVFKGDGGQSLVQVTISFPPDALAFAETGATFTNTVQLAYVAYNRNGTADANGSKTLDLALQPENREAVNEHGVRYAMEIPLSPGRYQLRLAATDSVGGRDGSVFFDVNVPEFNAPLAMSDVVITTAAASAAPSVNDADTLKTVFPGVGVASRTFTLEDTLRIFTEIYDRQAATPHDLDIEVSVLADDGFPLVEEDETRNTADVTARGSIAFVKDLALEDLATGDYILQIEVTSSQGGDPVVKRVPFTIR